MPLSQRAGGGDAVRPVEPDVHHDDVRLGLAGQTLRLVGIGGDGDARHLARGVDGQRQSLGEDRVVVHHHDRERPVAAPRAPAPADRGDGGRRFVEHCRLRDHGMGDYSLNQGR